MNLLDLHIEQHLRKLAHFTSTPGNGITRLIYSKEDHLAKEYIKREMKKLSLKVTEDEIGNIFAVWSGSDRSLPQVWTGSNLDTPNHGGKYNGVVGVVAGLEAIRLLKNEGVKPVRDLVLVVFASKEPSRFGINCLGSRALAGEISQEDLAHWEDETGQTLQEVLISQGRNPELVPNQKLDPTNVQLFIELHIEQGNVLDNTNVPIGIVNRIAAPFEATLKISGEQLHVINTPNTMQKDPMPAVAEIILVVEELSQNCFSASNVGTLNKVLASPGVSTGNTRCIEISFDIRDIEKTSKDQIITALKNKVHEICGRRKLKYDWIINRNEDPAVMNEEIFRLLMVSAKDMGLEYLVTPSWVYHNAMIMSRIVPSNLIFIPSQDGISHVPNEFTSTFHISKGINFLARVLEKLIIVKNTPMINKKENIKMKGSYIV